MLVSYSCHCKLKRWYAYTARANNTGFPSIITHQSDSTQSFPASSTKSPVLSNNFFSVVPGRSRADKGSPGISMGRYGAVHTSGYIARMQAPMLSQGQRFGTVGEIGITWSDCDYARIIQMQ